MRLRITHSLQIGIVVNGDHTQHQREQNLILQYQQGQFQEPIAIFCSIVDSVEFYIRSVCQVNASYSL